MDKKFEGKKLLIIGGTKTECDIVRYAKAAGVYTIVADYNSASPAMAEADKAVLISALDVDALVSFCEEEKVDGVITGFVDILLRPYMEVCKRLNLPCYITEKMLSMSTNKVDFKTTCDKYGNPIKIVRYSSGEKTSTQHLEYKKIRVSKKRAYEIQEQYGVEEGSVIIDNGLF